MQVYNNIKILAYIVYFNVLLKIVTNTTTRAKVAFTRAISELGHFP